MFVGLQGSGKTTSCTKVCTHTSVRVVIVSERHPNDSSHTTTNEKDGKPAWFARIPFVPVRSIS